MFILIFNIKLQNIIYVGIVNGLIKKFEYF